tara:strand:- start:10032 stop:10970 length:939 start_codon:yes stop_codon:yes gene_type:complete
MLGEWENLSDSYKLEWVQYINSFQKNYKNLPKNSFVDDIVYNFYTQKTLKSLSKDNLRKILNLLPMYNFETNDIKFKKAINAETKQAISTLYQVGHLNHKLYSPPVFESKNVESYLDSLNWSKPWTSGAQFASLCVYSKVNEDSHTNLLIKYSDFLVNEETGSYYKQTPSHSREIINGAMKVLSGLDWLDSDIHYPEKLIDYCINNKPITEGCDIVDYVYVLYRCSKQTDFKKKEILQIFDESIGEIKKLYYKNLNGFSYFKNKSQTHYYGVKISDGNNVPDLHGTLLCTWALLMILDTTENLKSDYKLIKP